MPDIFSQELRDRAIILVENLLTASRGDTIILDLETGKELIDPLFKNKKSEKEKYCKYGFCVNIKSRAGEDRYTVLLNYNRPIDEQLSVLGHEAGHVLLGHLSGPVPSNRQRDNQEWEANLFAAMFMFLLQGAVPIMEQYNTKFKGGVSNG